MVFEAPSRPERCRVTIDTNKILDELLLLHPAGKKYTLYGPDNVTMAICDDDYFKYIKGNGTYHGTYFGNPRMLIYERRYHCIWDKVGFTRHYEDGSQVNHMVQLAEVFGDITGENFSEHRARVRAHKYATQWAVNAVTGGRVNSPSELRPILNRLSSLIKTHKINEIHLENFLDDNPWILERGLGYKRYYSQVNIDQSLLMDTENGIRPDKFLERHDGFCDILDLKRPDERILVGRTNRLRASSQLTEAEAQIDNYVKFAAQANVRTYLQSKGIKVFAPKGIVLIGRRPYSNPLEWEQVKDRLRILAYTYDDLLEEVETLVQWVEQIGQE